MVLPLLEKVAAKDKQGRPAVAAAGEGGRFVKLAILPGKTSY